jgi:L-cysteine:1D-myo-inositol 2-amino-2-deoxy-alpha-D-glucopyranoside ligase
VKSWPTVEIPPLEFTLPKLKLKPTWGEFIDRSFYNSYICGITPYDATHLGHAATYITFDLIHRYQKLLGKSLNFTENITDVDDPLLERARRDKIEWSSLASDQISLFQRDMTALRILPPRNFLAVSETIDLVTKGMKALEAKNLIYEISGDWYYDISHQLKNLPMSISESEKIFAERGGDPQRSGKRNPLDPILWRKNIAGEPGWESPYGFGRPGWHIECSVIAIHSANLMADIGPYLDLQGGGRDLIFPHHFMTKIVAEDITGREFAAAYLHTGLLGLDGEKMSKSKGNLLFVHKLIASGLDPMVIRFALMRGRYSEDRMWSNELLETAQTEVNLVRLALSRVEVAPTKGFIEEMVYALSDDLNTQLALDSLLNWSTQSVNGSSGGAVGTMSRFIDSALGLAL